MNEYTFYNPETVKHWGEHKRKAKDLDHLRKFLYENHTKSNSSWVIYMGGRYLGTLIIDRDIPLWAKEMDYKDSKGDYKPGKVRLVKPNGKLWGWL